MSHTPGPWALKPYGVVIGGAPICLPGGEVQQQVAMVCTLDDGDRDDNARLIAAAPDLLAALTIALPFIDDAADVHSLFPESAASNACRAAVVAARAAIEKATKP